MNPISSTLKMPIRREEVGIGVEGMKRRDLDHILLRRPERAWIMQVTFRDALGNDIRRSGEPS